MDHLLTQKGCGLGEEENGSLPASTDLRHPQCREGNTGVQMSISKAVDPIKIAMEKMGTDNKEAIKLIMEQFMNSLQEIQKQVTENKKGILELKTNTEKMEKKTKEMEDKTRRMEE
ncbi:UNVERIFIED_CONTAM: hypothetical protein K2H54_045556 [Gekko kuhli]